jgi:tripartite-type tricarboxylate transporter receptor subunit TctC
VLRSAVDPGGVTPAEFARQVKADRDRWGPIVKASGFTPLD